MDISDWRGKLICDEYVKALAVGTGEVKNIGKAQKKNRENGEEL